MDCLICWLSKVLPPFDCFAEKVATLVMAAEEFDLKCWKPLCFVEATLSFSAFPLSVEVAVVVALACFNELLNCFRAFELRVIVFMNDELLFEL